MDMKIGIESVCEREREGERKRDRKKWLWESDKGRFEEKVSEQEREKYIERRGFNWRERKEERKKERKNERKKERERKR